MKNDDLPDGEGPLGDEFPEGRDAERVLQESRKRLEGWCHHRKARQIYRIARKAGSFVEIGVFGGQSLVPAALGARDGGGGSVLGVDPWSAAAAAASAPTPEDREWWLNAPDYPALRPKLEKFLKDEGLASLVRLVQATSREAFAAAAPVGAVHIDGGHGEESALWDVQNWGGEILRPGGHLILDDVRWPSLAPALSWLGGNGFSEVGTYEPEPGRSWAVYRKAG